MSYVAVFEQNPHVGSNYNESIPMLYIKRSIVYSLLLMDILLS